MARKVLWLFSGCYLILLGILGIAVHNASPGPTSQEILGVGIGRHDRAEGIVYLSGRSLSCSRPEDQAWAAFCTIEIANQPLEIHAQRNPPTHPNQLGGRCEAFYAGKSWPCHIDSRHVHVHWFAYLDEPLGLNQDQLDALRRVHLLENSESVFSNGVPLVSIITAVLALLTAGVWLWPRARNKFFCVLAALLCGLVAGVVSSYLALFLTNGFWD